VIISSGGSEKRLRRLRMTPAIRSLLQETHIAVTDFIYPLFIAEGISGRREISSMPGVFNLSLEELDREIDELGTLGIRAVLLFGIPVEKDECGSAAFAENGIVQRAIMRIKQRLPQIIVITDVCMCEYTSHGHCGILENGIVVNDATIDLLGRVAVSHAKAGADIVAPSDMMDLRVGAIRKALDEEGFQNVPIMSYSSKFSSAFYGPFRDAAQSTPAFGDRKSHQLNPANLREALLESETDVQEGADILMVKPALCYLDIISELRRRFSLPIAAYQVSGEYAMLKAAAANGWLDESRAVWETLVSIKRAGADLIITYFAKDIASGRLAYEF
jgi:porphobilinogen synthase